MGTSYMKAPWLIPTAAIQCSSWPKQSSYGRERSEIKVSSPQKNCSGKIGKKNIQTNKCISGPFERKFWKNPPFWYGGAICGKDQGKNLPKIHSEAICGKDLEKSPKNTARQSVIRFWKNLPKNTVMQCMEKIWKKNLPEKFGKAICVRDLSSGQAVFGVVARLKG